MMTEDLAAVVIKYAYSGLCGGAFEGLPDWQARTGHCGKLRISSWWNANEMAMKFRIVLGFHWDCINCNSELYWDCIKMQCRIAANFMADEVPVQLGIVSAFHGWWNPRAIPHFMLVKCSVLGRYRDMEHQYHYLYPLRNNVSKNSISPNNITTARPHIVDSLVFSYYYYDVFIAFYLDYVWSYVQKFPTFYTSI